MILFFKDIQRNLYFGIETETNFTLDKKVIDKLSWLFSGAEFIDEKFVDGKFVGPRREMITPWSTNAVEICQNMLLNGITRIEQFRVYEDENDVDFMLHELYDSLTQEIFTIKKEKESILYIDNIKEYNKQEGLALSDEEIEYLEQLRKTMDRKLTDSEIYGFAQVNSEHCRHKIFNGSFIIDGKEKEQSLFGLIKKTTNENRNRVVSAYKDNAAFFDGPSASMFTTDKKDVPDEYKIKDFKSVISLKAETHNFPTTVEPFNGAATGSGGEIRDRMACGKGSIPIAGTAVYMTSSPRINDKDFEYGMKERKWLYQTPLEILIKASNGASDFGNKFGQPLITGSVLTFEHEEDYKKYGFDKVIMLAGGIGYAKKVDSLKDTPKLGDRVVVMGGDNYRIGMGGGAVSSVATGEFDSSVELNAVQRANPEMQKRAFNVIRALVEEDENPIVSIHDHGAGGHLNGLSELVEETGGVIDLSKLPIGDPTLSDKEIIGNESQERMGFVIEEKYIDYINEIAKRERAPLYVVGDVTDDKKFVFKGKDNKNPMDLKLEYLFGKPPKTVLHDKTLKTNFAELSYDSNKIKEYVKNIFKLESVACKDWLTNKVDRSVTGKVAKQQTAGVYQLPLNNVGVVRLDYVNKRGIATTVGHAPVVGLVSEEAGSRIAAAEALTNLAFAPIQDGLKGISLSANWMWPAKNKGENARLYNAVKSLSDFALALEVNVPTGKDSLSMTQKYDNGDVVYSPGTVIVSSAGEVQDVNKVIEPVLNDVDDSTILYVDFSNKSFVLGATSFAQINNKIGTKCADVDAKYFKNAFNSVQKLIKTNMILSGHDVSAGGLITTLLETCFSTVDLGLDLNFDELRESYSMEEILFNENPALVIQVSNEHLEVVKKEFAEMAVKCFNIGSINKEHSVRIGNDLEFDVAEYRRFWFEKSYLLDKNQTEPELAELRYENFDKQPLVYKFKEYFTGKLSQYDIEMKRMTKTGIKAAVIREKGINGDREMSYSLHLAGFDVKDVHMTDLITGKENLEDVNFLVFPGGFSNSDVLGSAKGWAGSFLYNPKAKDALENFYKRDDTMSLGVCNGCQLMVELNLIYPEHKYMPEMKFNDSGKFESSFLSVDIEENNSVMLSSLSGSKLGVWVAHGEGKFYLPYEEDKYNIPMKYSYDAYPANPNGSMYSTAAICSEDGRHLAMMPHLERAIFPSQWGCYNEKSHQITPWVEAFVNAREWIKEKVKNR